MNIKDEHIDVVCSLLDQLVGNVTSRNLLQDMGYSIKEKRCLQFGKIRNST